MLEGLTLVWTPATVIAAIAAGLVIGIFPIGWLATRPRYQLASVRPAEYGILVAISVAIIGAAFYVAQIIAGTIDGDPFIIRAASRYALFAIFSPAMGLGTWLATRLGAATRGRETRAIAQDRLDHEDDVPRGNSGLTPPTSHS